MYYRVSIDKNDKTPKIDGCTFCYEVLSTPSGRTVEASDSKHADAGPVNTKLIFPPSGKSLILAKVIWKMEILSAWAASETNKKSAHSAKGRCLIGALLAEIEAVCQVQLN